MMSPGAIPHSAKLLKEHRIAKRADFVQTYDKGRKIHGRYTVLFILANVRGYPRIGITATRKVGRSNIRNRLKRWVRELFRTSRGPLGLEALSFDIVVNLKVDSAKTDYREFASDLERSLKRVKAVWVASGERT